MAVKLKNDIFLEGQGADGKIVKSAFMDALNELLDNPNIPAATGWKLGLLTDKIEKNYKVFNSRKNKIIEKYGTKNDDGVMEAKFDNKDFIKEYQKLCDQDDSYGDKIILDLKRNGNGHSPLTLKPKSLIILKKILDVRTD